MGDHRWQELTEDECRRLLSERHLGRLAVADADGAVIFPVNYTVDAGAVVFRADLGSKLDAAAAESTGRRRRAHPHRLERDGPWPGGRGRRARRPATPPHVAAVLAEELWWEAAPPARDLAEHWDQVAAARRRSNPVWSQVRIPVDGRPVAFWWLAEGRHWLARAELEDRALTLRSRDLPVESVELVRVLDLEPYLQGQRRLQATWARHYD